MAVQTRAPVRTDPVAAKVDARDAPVAGEAADMRVNPACARGRQTA